MVTVSRTANTQNPPAIWQVSGGPANRSYANVFLCHGVALIGSGDAVAVVLSQYDACAYHGNGAGRRNAASAFLALLSQQNPKT